MTDNHVTYRGSMKDTNIIQLPAEWKGKVDLETISVSLTPIATYQELFVDKNPTLETSWRSIILLGRNVASYKFALAKSLLEIDAKKTEIEIEKLAVPFAKNICEHLLKKENDIHS